MTFFRNSFLTRYEKAIAHIDPAIQQNALLWVNKVRALLEAPPLRSLPVKGAYNSITRTPTALAIRGLLTPDPTRGKDGYGTGGIKIEVGRFYTTVWEFTAPLGKQLAELFGTTYQPMKKLEYCCHRHAENEVAGVVVLPKALLEYEKAVVEACDAAAGDE